MWNPYDDYDEPEEEDEPYWWDAPDDEFYPEEEALNLWAQFYEEHELCEA